MKMKINRVSNNKYVVDESFFDKWSTQMAYVFGFTCADGNLYKGTLSWELSNKFDSNLDLLKSFRKVMKSDYPIDSRVSSYRLRISNLHVLQGIKKLGIIPNKKKVLVFPNVPKEYLRHFIRGFLDGDGWISLRKRNREVCVGFSNGSINFMKSLITCFESILDIKKFNLRCREKETKHGSISKTYQLEFYSDNARKILFFLYGNLSKDNLFLSRKYYKYLEALNSFDILNKSKKFGGKWIQVESSVGDLNLNLIKLLAEGFLPKDIAKKHRVSLSTVYRWLDTSQIRTFEKRGSEGWAKKIILSKKLTKNV